MRTVFVEAPDLRAANMGHPPFFLSFKTNDNLLADQRVERVLVLEVVLTIVGAIRQHVHERTRLDRHDVMPNHVGHVDRVPAPKFDLHGLLPIVEREENHAVNALEHFPRSVRVGMTSTDLPGRPLPEVHPLDRIEVFDRNLTALDDPEHAVGGNVVPPLLDLAAQEQLESFRYGGRDFLFLGHVLISTRFRLGIAVPQIVAG